VKRRDSYNIGDLVIVWDEFNDSPNARWAANVYKVTGIPDKDHNVYDVELVYASTFARRDEEAGGSVHVSDMMSVNAEDLGREYNNLLALIELYRKGAGE
jgi:hypothetical protein